MTVWEKRILELLAERYPSAAAATGGRALRLRSDSNFPELAEAGADETESFLEAAEELEKKGIVSLVWEKHRKGEAVKSLTLENPEALFALLDRPSPVTVLEGAKAAAREMAERAAGDTADVTAGDTAGGAAGAAGNVRAAGADFFAWLSASLRPEDAAAGIDAASVRSLGTLAAALDSGAGGPADAASGAGLAAVTPRALSVRLFSDSKYLESLVYRTRFLLQRAADDGVSVPDFSALDRSFPETMLAGRFALEFADAAPLENATGMIIGLPAASVRRAIALRCLRQDAARQDASSQRYPRGATPTFGAPPSSGAPPKVLSVENKETFYALAQAMQSAGRQSTGQQSDGLDGFDCILYTAGHPNPAVCALLGLLARSGFAFAHAGDLDPDGIIILQEVMRAAGRPVSAFGMDAAVFDRYLPYARDLTAGMLSRFVQLADETRALTGIEPLVQRILSTGKGVEQEVIDYSTRGTIIAPARP